MNYQVTRVASILKSLQGKPKTAAKLARQLKLPRLTIYRALQRLMRNGMVRVCGEAEEKRRGPKAKIYTCLFVEAYR